MVESARGAVNIGIEFAVSGLTSFHVTIGCFKVMGLFEGSFMESLDRSGLSIIQDKAGSIGLGILSWKDRLSLENALKSYQDENFFSLFDQTHVFFAEQSSEDHALAAQFGVSSSGDDENLGILGGFEALGQAMKTDYIVLVENDCPLIENFEEAKKQIEASLRLLKSGDVEVVRLRSLREPGELFNTVDKYKRMHGSTFPSFLKRLFRPMKAQALAGIAPYVEKRPNEKFPSQVLKTNEASNLGPIYKVDTRYLKWTNQSIMMRREFFLNQVIDYAKTAKTTRRVNGFRNLEIEMNSSHWRNNDWYVGMPQGIFTHRRVGNRGY